MSFTLDEFLGEYKAAEVSVRVPTRRDLGRQLVEVQRQIDDIGGHERARLRKELRQAKVRLDAAQAADATSNRPNRAPQVRQEVDELQEALDEIEERHAEEMDRLRSQGRQLEDDLRSSEREFVFTELSARTLSNLRSDSPPSKGDQKRNLDHNPETFYAKVVAAACVQPEGLDSEDDARRLAKVVGEESYGLLVDAAFRAQRELNIPSFSDDSEGRRQRSTS